MFLIGLVQKNIVITKQLSASFKCDPDQTIISPGQTQNQRFLVQTSFSCFEERG